VLPTCALERVRLAIGITKGKFTDMTVSTTTPSEQARSLINDYLVPGPGNSLEAIRAKMLNWQERANHPERFVSDGNEYAKAAIRKAARQNFMKLYKRHPGIVNTLPKLDAVTTEVGQ